MMSKRKEWNLRDLFVPVHGLRSLIIVVLLAVQGIAGLLFSLFLLAQLLAPGRPVIVSGISIIAGPVAGAALVVAIASPILAWSLWMAKSWVHQRLALLELFSLAIGAVELLEPGINKGVPIARMVIAALILIAFYVGRDLRALARHST
jgi:hypothetical protein